VQIIDTARGHEAAEPNAGRAHRRLPDGAGLRRVAVRRDWTGYREVTRSVKEQFDKAGISIPFPQRDMHIHHTTPNGRVPGHRVSPAAGEQVLS